MSATMPFTVVLSRRTPHGRWRVPQVGLAGILPCPAQKHGAENLREGAGLFAFHGVPLTLHRDLAESYWANVSGDNPRLFVVCREPEGWEEREEREERDESDSPARPVLLTASGDEAAGHNETDDLTFAAPMPDAARDFVEAFVMDNYFPEPKRKRKRQ